MGYNEVMDIPLRAFWWYNSQIHRVRAEENLHMMDLFVLGAQQTGDFYSQVREAYTKQMGEYVVASKPQLNPELETEIHKGGLAKLRKIKDNVQSV